MLTNVSDPFPPVGHQERGEAGSQTPSRGARGCADDLQHRPVSRCHAEHGRLQMRGTRLNNEHSQSVVSMFPKNASILYFCYCNTIYSV